MEDNGLNLGLCMWRMCSDFDMMRIRCHNCIGQVPRARVWTLLNDAMTREGFSFGRLGQPLCITESGTAAGTLGVSAIRSSDPFRSCLVDRQMCLHSARHCSFSTEPCCPPNLDAPFCLQALCCRSQSPYAGGLESQLLQGVLEPSVHPA